MMIAVEARYEVTSTSPNHVEKNLKIWLAVIKTIVISRDMHQLFNDPRTRLDYKNIYY